MAKNISIILKQQNLVGGVESYVSNLSKFLKDENFKISYIYYPSIIYKLGILAELFILPFYIFYLKNFVLDRNTHLIGNGAGLELVFSNSTTICHGTWTGFLYANRTINLKWYIKYLIRSIQLRLNLKSKFNKIIVSKYLVNEINISSSLFFIPPFFDVRSKYQIKNIDKFPFRILFCGRYDANKRTKLIISLAKNIIKSNKFKFSFVGFDYDYVENSIAFLGNLKHDEVLKIYSNFDFLILLSRYEGFPVVIIEALLNNCFIITTDNILKKVIGINLFEDNKDFIPYISNDYNDLKMNENVINYFDYLNSLELDIINEKFNYLNSLILKCIYETDLDNFIRKIS